MLLLFTNAPLVTGDIEALLYGLRCVRMIATHPLLHGTYPIITLVWIVAGSHKLWHSKYTTSISRNHKINWKIPLLSVCQRPFTVPNYQNFIIKGIS